jgi:hypothetical protein
MGEQITQGFIFNTSTIGKNYYHDDRQLSSGESKGRTVENCIRCNVRSDFIILKIKLN